MTARANRLGTTDHSRDSAGLTYVYPVVSRRAGGVSIGINLNPNNACNWRCIYCQVPELKRGSAPPIDTALLERELGGFLEQAVRGSYLREHVPEDARRIVDVALSGNGEPTSARQFPEVIALAARLLREAGLAGAAIVRVITNGSLVTRPHVQEGLRRLGRIGGEAWFKVDAGSAEGFRRINGVALNPEAVARNLRACAELCPTWVQTCRFALDGAAPEEAEEAAYLDLLRRAGVERLRGVLLYGLARPSMQPEAGRLANLPEARLYELAQRLRALGLTVRVSP
jgi:wyosine [tRNA(Phe)-imidazoG37] synthetase (radical SAM superfamily)